MSFSKNPRLQDEVPLLPWRDHDSDEGACNRAHGASVREVRPAGRPDLLPERAIGNRGTGSGRCRMAVTSLAEAVLKRT